MNKNHILPHLVLLCQFYIKRPFYSCSAQSNSLMYWIDPLNWFIRLIYQLTYWTDILYWYIVLYNYSEISSHSNTQLGAIIHFEGRINFRSAQYIDEISINTIAAVIYSPKKIKFSTQRWMLYSITRINHILKE